MTSRLASPIRALSSADDHVSGDRGEEQGAVAAGPAAVRGAAAVEHAGAQVPERPVPVLQGRPPAVQAEEGVLHDVLGRGLVAEHDLGQLDQAERVRLVERGDPLPAASGGVQGPVARP